MHTYSVYTKILMIYENFVPSPIGIPTAVRRIIATHVARQWKDKFALHLLPYNYAVGVPNGMEFIIKTMQLSIEQFIHHNQEVNSLPTRAAVFVDLTNMFNSVARDELFNIIHLDFPELTNLIELFYNKPGNVHYKWENTRWNTLFMTN